MPRSAGALPAPPIKRIGRDRFMRNVAYALGNSAARETALPAVEQLAERPFTFGARRGSVGAVTSRARPVRAMPPNDP